MADDKIRILIVDDHPIFCQGLIALLDPEKDMQIVGCATNGREAMRLYRETSPDITLLDIGLAPDMNGTQVLQAIRGEFPDARIIMLTVREEQEVISRSIGAGAASYLFKDTLVDDLMATIRHVYSGGTTRSPEVERKLRDRDARQPLAPRESEVLQLLGEGMGVKQIAFQLKLSVFTINEYIQGIYGKLSVHDRTTAVMVAIELGLLEPPQWKQRRSSRVNPDS